jgi:hypothetical protein
MDAENYFDSTVRLDVVLAELLVDLERRQSDHWRAL